MKGYVPDSVGVPAIAPSASVRPAASQASAAMMPGPPAFVTTSVADNVAPEGEFTGSDSVSSGSRIAARKAAVGSPHAIFSWWSGSEMRA